jgi:8-oxo-dGTP pyrophosphatase MutT (NUDIX family)
VVQDGADLLFARQPRFAARRHVVEIVKGGAGSGESLLECAKRELREELGIAARRWSELGILYEIPSIVAPAVAIFLARDLEFGSTDPGLEESISLVRMRIGDALAAAASGEIDDAVTIAALLRFALLERHVIFAPDDESTLGPTNENA